jgi:hypothetical protein
MTEQTTVSTPPAATAPALPKVSLDRLGSYYDGWTDLIENRGGKADQLRAEVVSILRQRYPEKPVEVVNGTIFVHKAPRPYLLTRTSPGATTTIYIADRGQDLHVSWRAFRGRVLNIVAKIVLIVAVLLTLILLQQLGNFFLAIAAFIIITGGLLWLLSQYSELVKGDPQAIFYKEASLFDQEDMVATNLSVHKSLLQALDKVGIDPKELRLKQNYNAGAGDGQI